MWKGREEGSWFNFNGAEITSSLGFDSISSALMFQILIWSYCKSAVHVERDFIHYCILLQVSASHYPSFESVPPLSDRRDKMKRESVASKLLEEKHQLKRLWLEVQLSVVCVRAQHCSSHRRCRIPHFPSLRLLPRSRYGKALRLQPQWANSQPVATAPIHNHRIEGSPKWKALLSLRLGATATGLFHRDVWGDLGFGL